MSKVLVTGGAGFIGSHLVDALLARGDEVVVLDNFATGKRENIAYARDKIELREESVCDPEAVGSAMERVEYVFHEAALPSVPRSVEDPIGTNEVNVGGALNVLVAARDAGVRRVICAASSSVYGDSPTLPRRETDEPSPMSPYAVAKLALENYCRVFTSVYGLETVCLRYFNVFGPRQNHESGYAIAIPSFITAMLKGERPVIFGDGSNSRDFTYVENAVRANILAMTAPGAAGEVFNVACGGRVTLNELVKALNRLIGTDIEPKHTDPRPGDVLHSEADISKAGLLLGYSPVVELEEGLRRTIEYYRRVV